MPDSLPRPAPFALLLIAACGSDVRVAAWPVVPEAQSQILAIRRASTSDIELRASAYAAALELGTAASGDGMTLELFLYDQGLETLGLTAGVLPAGEACARGCALLDPLESYSSRVEESGVPVGWQLAAPSAAVSEALVADFAVRCDRCVSDEIQVVPLPEPVVDTTTAFLAAAGDSSYVGLNEGEVFRVDAELDAQRVCRAGYTRYRLRGGVSRGDELWILNSTALHRLSVSAQDPDMPCVVETATVPGAFTTELRLLVGAPEPAPFELFALSDGGELHRYDGQTWTDSVRLEFDSGPSPSMTWLEPGLVAVGFGDERVAVVRGTSVQMLRVPVPNSFVRGQAYDPELGHAFLLRDHGLAILEEGAWRLETTVPEGWLNGRALIASDGGFLCTMSVGRFGRWYPERGHCPIQDGFGTEIVSGMVRMGDKVLFDRISDGSRFGPRIGAVQKPVSRCPAL